MSDWLPREESPLHRPLSRLKGLPAEDPFGSVSFNGCREGALETIVVDPRKVLTQDHGGKFIRLQDGGA